MVKLIGQWIPNNNGQGIARVKKNYLQTATKNYTKLGQFTNLGPFSKFQLLKLSKLCYHFCRVLKMKIFFLISLAIPCPLPARIHWPINFIKKSWHFCIFSKKKKKVTIFSATLLYISVLHFFLLEIYRNIIFFGKIEWSKNSRRRWAGDS